MTKEKKPTELTLSDIFLRSKAGEISQHERVCCCGVQISPRAVPYCRSGTPQSPETETLLSPTRHIAFCLTEVFCLKCREECGYYVL